MKFYHHNLENKVSTYIKTTNTDDAKNIPGSDFPD